MSATAPFFDVADPAFSVASDEVMAAREQGWYARTSYGLAILRYAEVEQLLKDRRLRQGSAAWPAHHGITSGRFVEFWSQAVLNREGEDHARLRRLLKPAFSPKLINRLAPDFRALADELVDAFAPAGRAEVVSQFAVPYAARVIALLLGLPDDLWPQIARWAKDLGRSLTVNIARDLPRVEAALEGLDGLADEVIAQRRAEPRDDVVTRLVQAQVEEDRLSPRELRDAIVILIFGGMDTTSAQIGLALATLAEHPDQWALLAERPDLGPNAVEEVMRVAPTTTWVTREATEDLELQGLHIAKGTTLHLLTKAAGTDPRVYGDAPFDITQRRPRHFGFGAGIHQCLGHWLARLDMAEALPLLARRLPGLRVEEGAVFLPVSGNTGPVRLPVAFQPGH